MRKACIHCAECSNLHLRHPPFVPRSDVRVANSCAQWSQSTANTSIQHSESSFYHLRHPPIGPASATKPADACASGLRRRPCVFRDCPAGSILHLRHPQVSPDSAIRIKMRALKAASQCAMHVNTVWNVLFCTCATPNHDGGNGRADACAQRGQSTPNASVSG